AEGRPRGKPSETPGVPPGQPGLPARLRPHPSAGSPAGRSRARHREREKGGPPLLSGQTGRCDQPPGKKPGPRHREGGPGKSGLPPRLPVLRRKQDGGYVRPPAGTGGTAGGNKRNHGHRVIFAIKNEMRLPELNTPYHIGWRIVASDLLRS